MAPETLDLLTDLLVDLRDDEAARLDAALAPFAPVDQQLAGLQRELGRSRLPRLVPRRGRRP